MCRLCVLMCMELARTPSQRPAIASQALIIFDGEERVPNTVPEWVAAVLQSVGLKVLTCVDRMCDLEWRFEDSITTNIDVSISDSNRIVAIQQGSAESVSHHTSFEQSAVIHIKHRK